MGTHNTSTQHAGRTYIGHHLLSDRRVGIVHVGFHAVVLALRWVLAGAGIIRLVGLGARLVRAWRHICVKAHPSLDAADTAGGQLSIATSQSLCHVMFDVISLHAAYSKDIICTWVCLALFGGHRWHIIARVLGRHIACPATPEQ